MLASVVSVLSQAISPVMGYFEKKEQRKTTEKGIAGKIAMKKDDNAAQVDFNNQEWEIISKRGEPDSWKDEWVTIVITMPLVFHYLSVFFGVLLNRPEIIEASSAALVSFKDLVGDYGLLLTIVICAALGIKVLK